MKARPTDCENGAILERGFDLPARTRTIEIHSRLNTLGSIFHGLDARTVYRRTLAVL